MGPSLSPGSAPSLTATAQEEQGAGAGTAMGHVRRPLQPLQSRGLRLLTAARKGHGARATVRGYSRTGRLWGACGTSLDSGHFRWTQTQ